MSFTEEDVEALYALAEKLTGTCQQGKFRKEILARNVEKRMNEAKCKSLADYLSLVKLSDTEYARLVSDLTIHTTSWFRESIHYEILMQKATDHLRESPGKPFRFWSAACSTGEELYSAGLVLEKIRVGTPTFEYQLYGSDIDLMSVKTAVSALYKIDHLREVPPVNRPQIFIGKNQNEGLFTLDSEIRKRTSFFQKNLIDFSVRPPGKEMDVVFCRNVLIYFDQNKHMEILTHLSSFLDDAGLLILGHCDYFASHPKLKLLRNSTYQKIEHASAIEKLKGTDGVRGTPNKVTSTGTKPLVVESKKRLLIVDDSPTIRKVLLKLFSQTFSVTECESVEAADRQLAIHDYDAITLDLNLPGENGASWLQRKRKQEMKTPVVIISDSSPNEAEKVFGALNSGAQEYITKSQLHADSKGVTDLICSLALASRPSHPKNIDGHQPTRKLLKFEAKNFHPSVIAIGASTGGPEALVQLLVNMPAESPPIVIVQHITPEFARAFASRIATEAKLKLTDVDEAKKLERGCIYLAQGDYHLKFARVGDHLHLKTSSDTKVHGHRPSVDVLFHSLAPLNIDSIAVLLTGMGRDGAAGLSKLAENSRTFNIAQSEESCVVFGMPKVALELGVVHFAGDLEEIRKQIENIALRKITAKIPTGSAAA